MLVADGGASAQATDDPRIASTDILALGVREVIWDGVEAFVDSEVCGRYKEGFRKLPDSVAGADFPFEPFVELRACSVRGLEFAPHDGGWSSLLLFEGEGFDRDGNRLSTRGERRAELSNTADGGWHIDSLSPQWQSDIRRDSPAFVERPLGELGLEAALDPKYISFEEPRVTRGGLGAFDLDGDGDLDLLVTARSEAQLFKNKGDLHFEKTSFSFAPKPGTELSAPAIGDFDGDGDPDVILTIAGNADVSAYVFRNDNGTLTPAGTIPVIGWVSGAVPFDFDGDGKLDLALVRYGLNKPNPNDFLEATNGRNTLIFRGDGKLGFTQVKTPLPKRWGLAAIAADVEGRGSPELYLANDYGSNDLVAYENGRFVQRADETHLRDPGNGMSADVGDVNNDGKLDLYVANMFSKAGTRVLSEAKLEGDTGALLKKFAAGNTLYLQNADGGFTEVAKEAGVDRGLWAFGSIFTDFDDDGRLDLAVANGYVSKRIKKDL
ncbi:MAG: FG-GAP repeat domain-containing protein [Myxococcaceae bacterium]